MLSRHVGRPGPPAGVYSGLWAISASTLLFQVTFTRIFSVSIWYHFAFLVVSTALFGFGASGVALLLIPRERAGRFTILAPALYGCATLLAYFGCNLVPFSPFLILKSPVQTIYFLLYVLLLAAPFFFAGVTVGSILRDWSQSASRLYAVDLVGAAMGSLAVFFTLPLLGAPGSVFLAAVLGLLAAVVMAKRGRPRMLFATLAVLLLPFLFHPAIIPDVRVDPTKHLSTLLKRNGRVVFSAWNALSRIDVVETPNQDPAILIDAAAMTRIRPDYRKHPRSDADINTLPYQLREGSTAIIIGSGGGLDVQNALAFGSAHVTAVEINPTIVTLVKGAYASYLGNVFSDPRVRLVRDEGRSFIQRDGGCADIIQLTLIDTWAAGTSGAYSLTENYLYTIEAFDTYLDHLCPEGLLAITRWSFETPRLASLGRAALTARGIADPGRHVLVVGQDYRSIFLMKRGPFSPIELSQVRALATHGGWVVQHDPLQPNPDTIYDRLLSPENPGAVIASSKTALNPVGDDSPFFFQMGRWSSLNLDALRAFTMGSFLEPLVLPIGQVVIVTALGLGVLLSIILLAIPLLRRVVPSANRYTTLVYFLILGVVYMIVEIVLTQRLALFLGHPIYSLTVVLFTLLVSSGIGSFWSDGRRGPAGTVMRPVVIVLPAALLFLAFVAPPITRALIFLPHPVRLLIAVLLVSPLGFLMGIPFPVGIRAAGESHQALVPWAWAANGCGSVIGACGAVLGAMLWGFTMLLVLAAALYALVLLGLSRSGLGAGPAVGSRAT